MFTTPFGSDLSNVTGVQEAQAVKGKVEDLGHDPEEFCFDLGSGLCPAVVGEATQDGAPQAAFPLKSCTFISQLKIHPWHLACLAMLGPGLCTCIFLVSYLFGSQKRGRISTFFLFNLLSTAVASQPSSPNGS